MIAVLLASTWIVCMVFTSLQVLPCSVTIFPPLSVYNNYRSVFNSPANKAVVSRLVT